MEADEQSEDYFKPERWQQNIEDSGEQARKDNAIQNKRLAKAARKRFVPVKIEGDFEQRHTPSRVRSFHKEGLPTKDVRALAHELEVEGASQMTDEELRFLKHSVMCTVEWAPFVSDDVGNAALARGAQKQVLSDSRRPYWEVRKHAPRLLCEFFERHLHFA